MAQTYKLVHGIDKVNRKELFFHVWVPEGQTLYYLGQSRSDVQRNFFTLRNVSEWNSTVYLVKLKTVSISMLSKLLTGNKRQQIESHDESHIRAMDGGCTIQH
jgi:hypothetical protein